MLAVNGLGVVPDKGEDEEPDPGNEDDSRSEGLVAVDGLDEDDTPPTGDIPSRSLSSQSSMTESLRETGLGAGSSPVDGPSSSSNARFVPAVDAVGSTGGGWNEKGDSSYSAGAGAGAHPELDTIADPPLLLPPKR